MIYKAQANYKHHIDNRSCPLLITIDEHVSTQYILQTSYKCVITIVFAYRFLNFITEHQQSFILPITIQL